jgi:hypothetical protein
VCGLLGACSSDQDSASDDTEALEARAAKVTDLLAKNDWVAVRADFDDNMRGKLSEDGLERAWKAVVDEKGAFKARGEPKQVPKPGSFVVFDTPMEFENGPMKSRVTFDRNARIAGLFILIPEVV